MKHLLIAIPLLLSLLRLTAQEEAAVIPQVIVGYCDRQSVIDSLPETTEANMKIAQLREEYDQQYSTMLSDYNSKVKSYIEGNKNMSEPIKMARQAEITELENRMNLYRKHYLEHVGDYTAQLFEPINALVDSAIGQAAQENGITILFDKGTPLYLSDSCVDITPAVREKLK